MIPRIHLPSVEEVVICDAAAADDEPVHTPELSLRPSGVRRR